MEFKIGDKVIIKSRDITGDRFYFMIEEIRTHGREYYDVASQGPDRCGCVLTGAYRVNDNLRSNTHQACIYDIKLANPRLTLKEMMQIV